LEEYNAVLYKLNEKVKLKKDNAVFETTIKAVTSEGSYLLKTQWKEHLISERLNGYC
jgi:biotin-(acetyl-CoA carboxylase) ligase